MKWNSVGRDGVLVSCGEFLFDFGQDQKRATAMAGRMAVAMLALATTIAPAAADFAPFTIIRHDIRRALNNLDQHAAPKARPKKVAPAKAGKTKDDVTKAAEPQVPMPRLRPAAAPETVGGFTVGPQFSEADEAPANAAEQAGVGGYLAATDNAAPAAPGEALGYAADEPPLPRVNPRIADAMAKLPAVTQPASKPVRLASLPPSDDTGGSVGMDRLNAMGISAKALAPIEESACGMPDPVLVASLDNGDIPLTGVAKVNHAIAMTFATWVRDAVEPAARAKLGEPLTGLRILDSYSCRTRDHIKNAKLSEHAHGNAIDVGAFRIGKQWITVGGKHTADQQAFLDQVRGDACGPFTTVLGPGSDSYHTDHFHLDLAKRRTSGPSHGLYCH
jgi:hypothetical protein